MRNLILTATLAMMALPATADDAALLLGIERYQDLRRVSQGADVVRTDDELEDAGYEVEALANGKAAEVRALLTDLAENATDADRLLVAMAGRFATDGDRTWFLTADAEWPNLFTLSETAISLESVMSVMAATSGQSILLLGVYTEDNSDMDTFLREGLGDINPPQGVTVIYGEPRYLRAFVRNTITAPGENVMDAVREERRLTALGYLPQTLIMQPDDAEPSDRPGLAVDTLAAWNLARSANTIESYQEFLENYPDSVFANDARRRLEEIESDPDRIDQLAEEGLRLTRNQRRAIQRDLTLLEFNTRGVDGIFGPGTRRAISDWQKDNDFNPSSYLNAEQISRIDAQARRRETEIAEQEDRDRLEAERLERAYWEETGARGDEAGYRAYLDRYPEGIFAEEAQNGLIPFSSEAVARAEEEALNLNPILIRLIERRLEQLGFRPGRVDGRIDADTRRAISRYQDRRNIPATGYLNETTVRRLLTETAGR